MISKFLNFIFRRPDPVEELYETLQKHIDANTEIIGGIIYCNVNVFEYYWFEDFIFRNHFDLECANSYWMILE